MLRLAQAASPADGDGAGRRSSHSTDCVEPPSTEGASPGAGQGCLHLRASGDRRGGAGNAVEIPALKGGADGALSAQRLRSSGSRPAGRTATARAGATAGRTLSPPPSVLAQAAGLGPVAGCVHKAKGWLGFLCSKFSHGVHQESRKQFKEHAWPHLRARVFLICCIVAPSNLSATSPQLR